MNTVMLWLLVSVGMGYSGNGNSPTNVVAKFRDGVECQRVLKLIKETRSFPPHLRCIEATVVYP
jgi:hypothetical protein